MTKDSMFKPPAAWATDYMAVCSVKKVNMLLLLMTNLQI